MRIFADYKLLRKARKKTKELKCRKFVMKAGEIICHLIIQKHNVLEIRIFKIVHNEQIHY